MLPSFTRTCSVHSYNRLETIYIIHIVDDKQRYWWRHIVSLSASAAHRGNDKDLCSTPAVKKTNKKKHQRNHELLTHEQSQMWLNLLLQWDQRTAEIKSVLHYFSSLFSYEKLSQHVTTYCRSLQRRTIIRKPCFDVYTIALCCYRKSIIPIYLRRLVSCQCVWSARVGFY